MRSADEQNRRKRAGYEEVRVVVWREGFDGRRSVKIWLKERGRDWKFPDMVRRVSLGPSGDQGDIMPLLTAAVFALEEHIHWLEQQG